MYNFSVQRRITRSLANSSQQANQEIGENVPDHLRYFYRSRHINMSNAIENAIENAIDNTIDNYEAMDIDEPEQMEISSEVMSRDNADTGKFNYFIIYYFIILILKDDIRIDKNHIEFFSVSKLCECEYIKIFE
jgi:post-segregation antitoxin (ccd killing protein)